MSKCVVLLMMMMSTTGPRALARELAVVISVTDGIQVQPRHARAVRRAVRRARPELRVESIKARLRRFEFQLGDWAKPSDNIETLVQTRTEQVEAISAQLYARLGEVLAKRPDDRLKLLVLVTPPTGDLGVDSPWLFPFGPLGHVEFSPAVLDRLRKLAPRVAPDLRIVALGAPLLGEKPGATELRLAQVLHELGAPRGTGAALGDAEFVDDLAPVGATLYQRLKYPSFLVLGGGAALLAHAYGLTHDFGASLLIAPAVALIGMVIDEVARALPQLWARFKRNRFGPRFTIGRQFRLVRPRLNDTSRFNYEVRTTDFVVGDDDALVFGCENALGAPRVEAESTLAVPRPRVRKPAVTRPHVPPGAAAAF